MKYYRKDNHEFVGKRKSTNLKWASYIHGNLVFGQTPRTLEFAMAEIALAKEPIQKAVITMKKSISEMFEVERRVEAVKAKPLTEEKANELLAQLQEAEYRMRKAQESHNGCAYRDAKKWRDKIKLRFDLERRRAEA